MNKFIIPLLISLPMIGCATKPNTYNPNPSLNNQSSPTSSYANSNILINLKKEYGVCGFLTRSNIISIDILKIIGKRYAILKNGSETPIGPYVVNQVNYKKIPNSDYFMFSLNGNEHLDLSEVYIEIPGQSRFINLGQTIDCYATNSAKALRLK